MIEANPEKFYWKLKRVKRERKLRGLFLSLGFVVCHVSFIGVKTGENWRYYNGRGARPLTNCLSGLLKSASLGFIFLRELFQWPRWFFSLKAQKVIMPFDKCNFSVTTLGTYSFVRSIHYECVFFFLGRNITLWMCRYLGTHSIIKYQLYSFSKKKVSIIFWVGVAIRLVE